METKRSNLRFALTVSLALAGLSAATSVLVYHVGPARAQDPSADQAQGEPEFEQIPVPDLLPEPLPPQQQLPEGFDPDAEDFGRPDDLDPGEVDPRPQSAPSTGPASAPAPVV